MESILTPHASPNQISIHPSSHPYIQRIDKIFDTLVLTKTESDKILKRVHQIRSKIQNTDSPKKQNIESILDYLIQKIQIHISKQVLQETNTLHITSPKTVRSLYYTSFAAGRDQKIEDFLDFIKKTEVNSITIDIKEVDGYIGFDMSEYQFGNIKPISKNRIKNIKKLIQKLHENNIYVIGRIVVFKDKLLAQRRPDLAIKWDDKITTWNDYKGHNYLDPYAKEVWDYTIDLSKAAYQIGFDEINFDYVRFPTDGQISKTYYPFSHKIQEKNPKWGNILVLDAFSDYITSRLKQTYPNIILSADIFGLVTLWDLFKIGQSFESFALYFDYLGPMMYPSHYSKGMLGYENPDNHPYPIIKHGLQTSIKKIDTLNQAIKKSQKEGTLLKLKDAFYPKKDITHMKTIPKDKLRPWIQGFSCTRCKNHTPYNRTKFRQQIKAIQDVGLNGWWVWNSASNYYLDWYTDDKYSIINPQKVY